MGTFTFRIDETLHAKSRVLAAFKNISLNELCTRALRDYIEAWEDECGEVPLPPDNP